MHKIITKRLPLFLVVRIDSEASNETEGFHRISYVSHASSHPFERPSLAYSSEDGLKRRRFSEPDKGKRGRVKSNQPRAVIGMGSHVAVVSTNVLVGLIIDLTLQYVISTNYGSE